MLSVSAQAGNFIYRQVGWHGVRRSGQQNQQNKIESQKLGTHDRLSVHSDWHRTFRLLYSIIPVQKELA
jgi:hypothetical protein